MTRILVADDEAGIRQIVKLMLTTEGYETIEAADGGSAYTKATEEKPDIILLDVVMPVMDGFTVLEKLKADPHTMNIPVIILSVKRLPRDEERAMRAGALDYITKPWASGELEDRVRLALTYLDTHRQDHGAGEEIAPDLQPRSGNTGDSEVADDSHSPDESTSGGGSKADAERLLARRFWNQRGNRVANAG